MAREWEMGSCNLHGLCLATGRLKALIKTSTLVWGGLSGQAGRVHADPTPSAAVAQVPQQLGDDPTKLGLLLELSKDLARKIDGGR
jgi:hypothetical protein